MSLVTVYVPTYNRRSYLERCLTSIVNQTFSDFRTVVIDNGGDEDLTNLMREFGDKVEFRRFERNIGFSGAFMDALQDKDAASGYAVVFHDDDEMHPEMLARLVAAMEEDPNLVFVVAAATTPYNLGRAEARSLETAPILFADQYELARKLISDFPLPLASVIYNREIARSVRPDTERFSILWDRPFLLELASRGKTALIPQPLMTTGIHANQVSNKNNLRDDHVIELFAALREALMSDWTITTRARYYAWTGRHAIPSYVRLQGANRRPFISFIKLGAKRKVFRYPFLLFHFVEKIKSALRRLINLVPQQNAEHNASRA